MAWLSATIAGRICSCMGKYSSIMRQLTIILKKSFGKSTFYPGRILYTTHSKLFLEPQIYMPTSWCKCYIKMLRDHKLQQSFLQQHLPVILAVTYKLFRSLLKNWWLTDYVTLVLTAHIQKLKVKINSAYRRWQATKLVSGLLQVR